jgi:hypothetical protein
LKRIEKGVTLQIVIHSLLRLFPVGIDSDLEYQKRHMFHSWFANTVKGKGWDAGARSLPWVSLSINLGEGLCQFFTPFCPGLYLLAFSPLLHHDLQHS